MNPMNRPYSRADEREQARAERVRHLQLARAGFVEHIRVIDVELEELGLPPCPVCGGRVAKKGHGPTPTYCSRTCQVRALRGSPVHRREEQR